MNEEQFTLEAFDVDGVLDRAADAVALPTTRRKLLRSAVGGAAALFGGLAAADSVEAANTHNDVEILRFDLVLEYLQAALYTEAERLGRLHPTTLGWARVVGAHERAHAAAIKALLGKKAVSSPSFDFRGVTTHEQDFVRTAVAFEDLTAALLKWQAPRLDSRNLVAAVATLHTVETRHAAWIRRIVGLRPAAHAFDDPAPQHKMAQLVASTHFISRKPATTRQRLKPKYTG
jgi:hypothetical protein